MSSNRFARPVRTDADRALDAYRFIAGATPEKLLAITPDELCLRYGVHQRERRREVEARLLAAQDRERRRNA